MYGKLFSSLYEGSMVGSGAHVFAVWGYCIANADPDEHTVRLNPALLSAVLGEPIERVKDAIEFLSSPDAESHCSDEEGKRLLNTAGMEYLLVTHEYYRDIKTSADHKEYMRKYMRDYRNKQKQSDLEKDVNSCKDVSLQTFTSVSVSASVSEQRKSLTDDFEECWEKYPSKTSKASALKSYLKYKPSKQEVLDGIARYVENVAQQRANGFRDLHYANGSTWFNQKRWEDVYPDVHNSSHNGSDFQQDIDIDIPIRNTPGANVQPGDF